MGGERGGCLIDWQWVQWQSWNIGANHRFLLLRTLGNLHQNKIRGDTEVGQNIIIFSISDKSRLVAPIKREIKLVSPKRIQTGHQGSWNWFFLGKDRMYCTWSYISISCSGKIPESLRTINNACDKKSFLEKREMTYISKFLSWLSMLSVLFYHESFSLFLSVLSL